MQKFLFHVLFLLCILLSLNACGKKAPPKVPEGQPDLMKSPFPPEENGYETSEENTVF